MKTKLLDMRQVTFHRALLITVCAGHVGCLGGNAWFEESSLDFQNPLYVQTGNRWTGGIIPVCFTQWPSIDQTAVFWVKNQVEQTWGANSGIRFSGWNSCAGLSVSTPAIRIYIEDTKDPPRYGPCCGTAAKTNNPSMFLNFTFNIWSPSCKSNREYCIRAIAAHEFGHALGFVHEQNRPDTPSSCTAPNDTSTADATYGAWDLNSIMNYCSTTWNNGGVLSSTDIGGAQLYYGMLPDSYFGPINQLIDYVIY